MESLPHSERYADSDIAGGIWGEGPNAIHSFSAWTTDDCYGDEVFGLNQTGHEAGFCQVLDDNSRWREWQCVLHWIIEANLTESKGS